MRLFKLKEATADSARKGALTVIFAVLPLMTPVFAVRAHADGVKMPERAFRKLPAIPSQRALISYRDGVERLVVQSSLDGPGKRFGWILPVPSKPVQVEQVSAGLLNTLAFCTRPKITHDLTRWIQMWAMGAAAVAFGALLLILFKSREIVLAVLFLIAIPFFSLFLLPSLGTAGGGGPGAFPRSGVRVEESLTVGSYEVNVLAVEKAEDLNRWLDEYGFRKFGEKGLRIVGGYIAEGWHFVTAQLRRKGNGYSKPHPLAVTFPTNIPVYPMRLTALNGHPLYLELFVAADFEAVTPGLGVEFCDILNSGSKFHIIANGPRMARFRGEEHRLSIFHPEAEKLLWDQCVLTKLAGRLEPEQMSEDFRLNLIPAVPHRKHFYSHRGAREAGLVGALSLWIAAVIASLMVFQQRIAGERGRRFAFVRILGPVTLGGLLFWGAFYVVAPKASVRTGPPGSLYLMNRLEYQRATRDLGKETQHFKGMTCSRIAEVFEDYFRRNKLRNVVTGDLIRCEYSPGNFIVLLERGNAVIVLVERYGMPRVWDIIPNVVQPPKRTVRPHLVTEGAGARS